VAAGWTGAACDVPDCAGGCMGNGFCNGTGRDIPECQCLQVGPLAQHPLLVTVKIVEGLCFVIVAIIGLDNVASIMSWSYLSYRFVRSMAIG
jgi:hypothetical protein